MTTIMLGTRQKQEQISTVTCKRSKFYNTT